VFFPATTENVVLRRKLHTAARDDPRRRGSAHEQSRLRQAVEILFHLLLCIGVGWLSLRAAGARRQRLGGRQRAFKLRDGLLHVELLAGGAGPVVGRQMQALARAAYAIA